jgi:hypothetical protein
LPETYRALLIAGAFGLGFLFVYCRKLLRKGGQRPTRLEISESSFTILGPSSKISLQWSAFSECLESDDLFVLLDKPKTTLFVIPKRVFPDEDSRAWFREQARHGPNCPESEWDAIRPKTIPESADRVLVTFQLGFRDHLAGTVASWRTWGMCLALTGLLLGVSLYSAANPPPDAVTSPAEVFVLFMFFMVPLCVAIVVMMFTFVRWRSDAKHGGDWELSLSETGLAFTSPGASGVFQWSDFKYYKETPWHFIIWQGARWMMLPKRAFASWDDLERCGDVLNRHLRNSRWFMG